jgi:hypothetical protein
MAGNGASGWIWQESFRTESRARYETKQARDFSQACMRFGFRYAVLRLLEAFRVPNVAGVLRSHRSPSTVGAR